MHARMASNSASEIAPGTRWEDIPEEWTCPECGVSKDDFELLED